MTRLFFFEKKTSTLDNLQEDFYNARTNLDPISNLLSLELIQIKGESRVLGESDEKFWRI